jgi:hypothetical protein
MAQAFLHAQQHGRVLARLGIDDAVRMKANRIECGRKQVRPLQHPQHLAREPRQNAPDQQHRGRAVLDIRSAAGDLVQGAQRQATAGQVAIDSPSEAEREDRACGLCRPPDMGDAGPQCGQTGRCRVTLFHHAPRAI